LSPLATPRGIGAELCPPMVGYETLQGSHVGQANVVGSIDVAEARPRLAG